MGFVLPDLVRVVVAIDPAASSGEDADETGIIVAGKDKEGRGYVLADLSDDYTPTEWARVAIAAYRAHGAEPDRCRDQQRRRDGREHDPRRRRERRLHRRSRLSRQGAMSANCNRPPGRSTRRISAKTRRLSAQRISAKTRRLSAQRLMTPLLITASARTILDRRILDERKLDVLNPSPPLRRATGSAFPRSYRPRQRDLRSDLPAGREAVKTTSRPEIDYTFAPLQR